MTVVTRGPDGGVGGGGAHLDVMLLRVNQCMVGKLPGN